jgi:hypothetical protein
MHIQSACIDEPPGLNFWKTGIDVLHYTRGAGVDLHSYYVPCVGLCTYIRRDAPTPCQKNLYKLPTAFSFPKIIMNRSS